MFPTINPKGGKIMFFPTDFKISGIKVMFHDFKKSESLYVPGRIHHGLTFRLSGKISILPDGADKKLYSDKNCITYVPKGCSYATEILEDGKMLIMHFETDNNIPDLFPFVYRPTYPIAFENMFRSLLDRSRNVGNTWDYSCLSMAYEIFANLHHEFSERYGKSIPKRMRNIKDFIDEHYCDRNITIPRLSDSCGISAVYFRKEFKECFGVSPLEYIKNVRIENAKGLLSTGLYTVSEVATRCGFDSISYFSYEFKRKCGESPAEFAKSFEDIKS